MFPPGDPSFKSRGAVKPCMKEGNKGWRRCTYKQEGVTKGRRQHYGSNSVLTNPSQPRLRTVSSSHLLSAHHPPCLVSSTHLLSGFPHHVSPTSVQLVPTFYLSVHESAEHMRFVILLLFCTGFFAPSFSSLHLRAASCQSRPSPIIHFLLLFVIHLLASSACPNLVKFTFDP